jgi:hypothetical protein
VKENAMNLDTLLRESATVDDPSPRALQAARGTLDAATRAAADRRVAVARRISLRRHRRHWRLGLTALVGVAATLAVVIAPTLGVGGAKPPATAAAAEVLIRAGAAAGEQPDISRDAAYWHSVASFSDVRAGRVGRLEAWNGHTAPSIFIETDSVTSAIGPKSGEPFVSGKALYGAGLSWDDLYALPTEPAALETELRRRADRDHPEDVADTTMWGDVTEMLMDSPASPALRKALWELAARIPGATLGGAVADSTGRPGVAVNRDGDRFIVDPDTGRLLEEIGFSADTPGGVYREDYRRTFLEQGPTGSAPAVKMPVLAPGCTLYGC